MYLYMSLIMSLFPSVPLCCSPSLTFCLSNNYDRFSLFSLSNNMWMTPIQSLLFSVCFHLSLCIYPSLSLPSQTSLYLLLSLYLDLFTLHLSLSFHKDKEEEEAMKVEAKSEEEEYK